MALSRRTVFTASFYLLFLIQACIVVAEKSIDASVAGLSIAEIEEQLQECPVVESLNKHKAATINQHGKITDRIFSVLFPSAHPAINALLGTLYISGPPNFLLALCPPNIEPSSLSVMVAFAVGGLLGDTLFHLLPEIFLGEDEKDKVRFVMLEPNRNLLLGVAILVGFMTFVAMDKGLRIATGGEAHSHEHGHTHKHVENDSSATTTGTAPSKDGAKRRKTERQGTANGHVTTAPVASKPDDKAISHTGLLNLLADFTHNITDGLAMSSSFYASPALGATTVFAVFFHEIPHEVGDFALLIQSGFSKRAAMGAQFITALGALLGTVIGILVQEYGGSGANTAADGPGIWGTSLSWGDMLLPFTAGTFLYVGTVAVIPEMLETGKDKALELRKTLVQFLAVAAGAGIMLVISWS